MEDAITLQAVKNGCLHTLRKHMGRALRPSHCATENVQHLENARPCQALQPHRLGRVEHGSTLRDCHCLRLSVELQLQASENRPDVIAGKRARWYYRQMDLSSPTGRTKLTGRNRLSDRSNSNKCISITTSGGRRAVATARLKTSCNTRGQKSRRYVLLAGDAWYGMRSERQKGQKRAPSPHHADKTTRHYTSTKAVLIPL